MAAKVILDQMRQKQRQIHGEPPPSPPTNEAGPRPAPKGKGGPRFPEFRLLHGAAFKAVYDAQEQRWTVTLTVPGWPPMQTVAGGVHTAMIQLGRRWFTEHGALDKSGG